MNSNLFVRSLCFLHSTISLEISVLEFNKNVKKIYGVVYENLCDYLRI